MKLHHNIYLHLDVLPRGVIVHALVDVVLQTLREAVHERCARSDAVRVKVRPLFLLGRQISTILLELLPHSCHRQDILRGFFGSPEPPGALLVHLGPWGDTIDSHVQDFPRPGQGYTYKFIPRAIISG